jgi:hypothetical protein
MIDFLCCYVSAFTNYSILYFSYQKANEESHNKRHQAMAYNPREGEATAENTTSTLEVEPTKMSAMSTTTVPAAHAVATKAPIAPIVPVEPTNNFGGGGGIFSFTMNFNPNAFNTGGS